MILSENFEMIVKNSNKNKEKDKIFIAKLKKIFENDFKMCKNVLLFFWRY